jgi:hypothetical protein
MSNRAETGEETMTVRSVAMAFALTFPVATVMAQSDESAPGLEDEIVAQGSTSNYPGTGTHASGQLGTVG